MKGDSTMIYGYHRTSTTDQHLDRGMTEIETFCNNSGIQLEKIYTDQQTGKNFNRPRYQVLKEDILLLQKKNFLEINCLILLLGRLVESLLIEIKLHLQPIKKQ